MAPLHAVARGHSAFVFVAVLALATDAAAPSHAAAPASDAPDAFVALALGDWGMPNAQHTSVAAAMEKAALIPGPATGAKVSTVLNVGDNSYITALDSHGNRQGGFANNSDPLWRKYFTDAYTGSLASMPFVSVLGNHDYMGNVSTQVGDAGYHSVDKRWVMPHRYYTQDYPLSGGQTLTLVFLDTSPFIAGYYSSPENPTMAKNLAAQNASVQVQWLEATLAGLTRPGPVVVVGHHPIMTGYELPDASQVLPSMDIIHGLVNKYNATAYLCGHVHTLEYAADAQGVGYFVTGAGATGKTYPSYTAPSTASWTSGDAGFLRIEVTATTLHASFLNTELVAIQNVTLSVPARPAQGVVAA